MSLGRLKWICNRSGALFALLLTLLDGLLLLADAEASVIPSIQCVNDKNDDPDKTHLESWIS